MEIAVGASTVVCYTVDVCYWECPLTKVPLYYSQFLHLRAVYIMWSRMFHCQGHRHTSESGGVEHKVHFRKWGGRV